MSIRNFENYKALSNVFTFEPHSEQSSEVSKADVLSPCLQMWKLGLWAYKQLAVARAVLVHRA